MKDDFEAIKAAAKRGWAYDFNNTLARDSGLPSNSIHARQENGYWEVEFFRNGPLSHCPTATGKTRAEAAARLICEARRYLEREKNAEAVTA